MTGSPITTALGRPTEEQRSHVSWSSRLPTIVVGAVAGGFLAFMVVELGLREMMAWASGQQFLLAGLAVGAVAGAFGFQRIVLALDGLTLLAYLVIANTPLMFNAATAWVRADSLPRQADAIVVLSAGINSEGQLSADGVQRLLTGVELAQRGIAPRLLTTMIADTFPNGIRSSAADQGRLVALAGVRGEWSWVNGVQNTHDEATRSAAALPSGARSIVLVTSPMHTRRACATFETVGFKVACVPSREQDHVTWHPTSSTDRLQSFREYAYERIGIIKYRAKGWVARSS